MICVRQARQSVSSAVMGRVDSVLEDVCRSPGHPLETRLRGWMQASRTFTAFVEANASKVRRKLRVTDPAALADVDTELAVAAWLLRERRWTLVYEPLAASGGRGPDVRVAAPDGSGAFFVEVTRLRGGAVPLTLARSLADKVGQLPAGAVTVLAAVLPPGVEGPEMLSQALRLLEQAVHTTGETLGSLDGRAFALGRHRLGAVLVGSLDAAGTLHTTLYPLSGARHPLPPETARRLRALG